AFREHYGIRPAVRLVGGYQGNLSNSDDVIGLRAPSESEDHSMVVVDAMHYDDRPPWPTDADGGGRSLQRSSSISNGFAATSWRSARPTPGVSNYLDTVHGDTTGDGVVDSHDIDRLFDAVQSRADSKAFDLNGDNMVDQDDVAFLVNDLLQSSIGDANLDSVFNSTDFVFVFQAAEYEDQLIGNSTWAEGDWDGNGDFTTADFVVAFQVGRYVAV
ncbi:MAG: hypothetical protein KDB27_26440, partial [Planctomycetales bacterium]|nr:hypothetical protein [Planctomycetales bacterium]